MSPEAEDADLLRRIGEGDPLAVAALYDRYAKLLYALARRIVRDGAEAEDVLHDAFVIVGERARQYVAERGSVSAWLVTLVRNLSIDRMRRRDRRSAITRDALAHDPSATAPAAAADPESSTLLASDVERARKALEALSPVQRGTLEMAFFEGLTYQEIADRENVPVGTIKSRAARALAALREALESERSP
jgi:RNA polymerase sigma-70 factor (ECF subfamily)